MNQRRMNLVDPPARFPRKRNDDELARELLKEIRINNILLAASLPSAPEISSLVTVNITPTPIFENVSRSILHLKITNNDPAQPIFLGGPGVTVGDGEQLLAQQSVIFTLGYGQRLFAVCFVAGILPTRISQGFDFLTALRQRLE